MQRMCWLLLRFTFAISMCFSCPTETPDGSFGVFTMLPFMEHLLYKQVDFPRLFKLVNVLDSSRWKDYKHLIWWQIATSVGFRRKFLMLHCCCQSTHQQWISLHLHWFWHTFRIQFSKVNCKTEGSDGRSRRNIHSLIASLEVPTEGSDGRFRRKKFPCCCQSTHQQWISLHLLWYVNDFVCLTHISDGIFQG